MTLIFKKGNHRPVSLTLVPGKIREQVLLEPVVRLMVNNVAIGDCQYAFTKGKSHLKNLVAWEDLLEPFPIPTGSLQEGWRGTRACRDSGNGLKMVLLDKYDKE